MVYFKHLKTVVDKLLKRQYNIILQAERARKNAETELGETSQRLTEVQLQITVLTNDKRRLEGDIAAMQSDLDDALNAQRAAEERADRLAAEVNRLAGELHQEQENYKNAESLRKQLEVEIREITVRLEEAEAFATREGKRQIAKLQARVSTYQKYESIQMCPL